MASLDPALGAQIFEIDPYRVRLAGRHRLEVGVGKPHPEALDDDVSRLDPRQRSDVLSLIKGLAGQHTVILSTHILPEVKATCQRVLIIHRGKMVAHDDIGKLADPARETGLEEVFIRLTAA